ncbi:MAG: 3-dehydroquinate synthase [Paramuribaculum sp.]|nr:3-dehydroquinate synthase [Paramuribaculum sp.]
MSQQVIFTENPGGVVDTLISDMNPAGVCIIADSNTAHCVLPRLREESAKLKDAPVIEFPAGDGNKILSTLASVWEAMESNKLTRRSLIVNAGGGVVTDLGGFAAATFKRGLRFVNLPTTLLSAVDAAVGGKTGINFNGLKNEIGVFKEADAVVVSTRYFSTLPSVELLSGYGEVIKHALIDSSENLLRVLDYDISGNDLSALQNILCDSVEVKRRIVKVDPYEKGLRKSLNLGHTVAHAIEAQAMRNGVAVPAHGVAVVWGLIVDMVLSHMLLGLDSKWLHAVARYVRIHYPAMSVTCSDYTSLIELMRHDKKNTDTSSINFTLLEAPGKVVPDCIVSPDDIRTALDITRDLLGV